MSFNQRSGFGERWIHCDLLCSHKMGKSVGERCFSHLQMLVSEVLQPLLCGRSHFIFITLFRVLITLHLIQCLLCQWRVNPTVL